MTDPGQSHPARARALGAAMLYVSHELKTTLTVIEIVLATIQRRQAAGRSPRPQDLAVLEASLKRGMSLLEEILHFAGTRPLRHEPIQLPELVGDVAQMIRAAAEGAAARGRTIVVSERYTEPLAVLMGDRRLLEASLINLGFNALQAIGAADGQISFRVAPAGGGVEIRIRDSGPGVQPGASDGPPRGVRSPKEGGTGLGLPIARGGVAAHGGQVTLRNVEGGGTEAIVWLPASRPVP